MLTETRNSSAASFAIEAPHRRAGTVLRVWSPARFGDRIGRMATGLIDLLLTWQTRWAERQHLMSMSEHQLHDLGLSRADLDQEAHKPFWRP